MTAALCLLGSAPLFAQSTNNKTVTVRDDSEKKSAACTFTVRDDLASTLQSQQVLARPPSQTLTVASIAGLAVPAGSSSWNQFIDNTLGQASTLLQAVQNPPADVNCCVDMRRSGAVGTFNAPSGVVGGAITTSAQLTSIHNLGAGVRIVASINLSCCNNGNTCPCTLNGQRSGTSLIVQVNAPVATYAHEFGHMQGLGHVSATCSPTAGACGNCTCTDGGTLNIMFCSSCAGVNRNTISSSECSSYQSGASP